MKQLFCLFFIILLCSGILCLNVSAAETDQVTQVQEIDFDNVDWSTIDWNTVPPGALSRWIQSQEDLNKLFPLYDKRPEYDYSWGITLTERLLADPAAFMRALAKETPELQATIANVISRGVYNELNPGFSEFPNAIYSTTLTDDDSAETKHVLTLFENAVETYWGIPKTGDSLNVFVVLLAISGLFGGILITQRKRFTA